MEKETFLQLPKIEEIIENFSFIEDWEDRYRYIMELGNLLPKEDPILQKEENKISGCVSQVWLTSQKSPNDPYVLFFQATSDAHIVRGLITILLSFYSGKTAQFILEHDAEHLFEKLQLKDNLSSQRANGLRSMIARIRKEAHSIL